MSSDIFEKLRCISKQSDVEPFKNNDEWSVFFNFCQNLFKLVNAGKTKQQISDFSQQLKSLKFENKCELILNDDVHKSVFKNLVSQFMQRCGVENCGKDSSRAMKARIDGNRLFVKSDYQHALSKYSEALLYTPHNEKGNLAICFANHSAAFYYLKRYSECLQDINEAIKVGYHRSKLHKLLARKIDCLCNLNRLEDAKICIDECVAVVNENLSDSDEIKMFFESKCNWKLIEKNRPKETGNRSKLMRFQINSNRMMPNAADSIEMKYSNESGRYICATKNLLPGEVIIIEKPFVSWLKPSLYDKYCHYCFKPLKDLFVPCEICASVKFCDFDCRQQSLSKFHRIECSYLSELKYLSAGHMVVRAMIVSQYDDLSLVKFDETLANWKEKIFDCNLTSTLSIPHHIESKNQIIQNALLFGSIFLTFLCEKLLSTVYEPNFAAVSQLIYNLLGVYYSNIMAITDEKMRKYDGNEFFVDSKDVGSGIYPTICLLNHSCDPNVVYTYDGNTAICSVVDEIKIGDELFDSYGPYWKKTVYKQRQAFLNENYKFICKCRPCSLRKSDTREATICSNCKGPVIWNIEKLGNCLNCDEIYNNYNDINKKLTHLGFQLESISKLMSRNEFTDAQLKLETCIKTMVTLLFPGNKLMVQCNQKLIANFIAQKKFDDAKKLCEDILRLLEKRDGRKSYDYIYQQLILANLLKRESIISGRKSKSNDGEDMYNEAMRLLNIVKRKEIFVNCDKKSTIERQINLFKSNSGNNYF